MSALEQDIPTHPCADCGYLRPDDSRVCPNPGCPSNQEPGAEPSGEQKTADARTWAKQHKAAMAALVDAEPGTPFTVTVADKTFQSPGNEANENETPSTPDNGSLEKAIRSAASLPEMNPAHPSVIHTPGPRPRFAPKRGRRR